MNEQATEDRRVSLRIGFEGVVLVRTARQQIACQALNLSETGILVRPARRANPGSQFRVTFALPEQSGWVDLEGRLVHRTWIHRRVFWGIQFTGVPGVVRSKLQRFVTTDVPSTRAACPRMSSERPLQPEPRPVEMKVIEHKDGAKEGPTRRVEASRLKQLAGEEDTREISLSRLSRLMEISSSDDGE